MSSLARSGRPFQPQPHHPELSSRFSGDGAARMFDGERRELLILAGRRPPHEALVAWRALFRVFRGLWNVRSYGVDAM